MTTIAQDLGDVLRLLEKATPGPWTVGRFGSVHRPKVEGSESSVGSAIVVGGSKSGMYDGYKENCEAIAAAVNFLRTHSAEIAGALRDAERWRPIETAPRDGTKVLLYHHGYKSAFYRRDHEPRVWVDVFREGNWYNTAPSAQPTHWRPLPAPPTQDSAMQQGGGGE